MLVSEYIKELQDVIEKAGDQDLYLWLQSSEGTNFLVDPEGMKFAEINCNNYQIKPNYRKKHTILTLTNFSSDEYSEELSSIQDFSLEVLDINDTEGE